MREVQALPVAEVDYKWPDDELVVRLSDYDALAAECERLRAEAANIRARWTDYGREVEAQRDAALAELAALKGGQEAVATVTISHFRQDPTMENVDFQLDAKLPCGTHKLYLAPPAQPQQAVAVAVAEGWRVDRANYPNGYVLYSPGGGMTRICDSGGGGVETAFAMFLKALLAAAPVPPVSQATFTIGDHVRKTKGSRWQGVIVGTYSTALTPEGYAVESDTETGSVQIYPVSALERVRGDRGSPSGESLKDDPMASEISIRHELMDEQEKPQ